MQDKHHNDSKLSAGRIAKQLLEHPQLLRKFEEMLATLDVEKNSLNTADEAEMHILELTRKLGKDLLQEWAQEKHDCCVEKSKDDGIIKSGKKKLKWHSLFGVIVIIEQVLRNSRRGSSFRPFSSQVNVSPRGYSMPLQRAMTDFGCERSFAKATCALYEHYGVDIAQSAERFFTLKHAKRIPPEPIVRTIPSKGAPWIAHQAQLQFGDDCFLLDFYHLCEYLQPAAIKCDPNAPEQWMNRQRELLKQSKSQEVLHTLSMNIETDCTLPDDKAPVRCAHRYMSNRFNQLDYKSAIEKGLPIGSGIIESAHGHIIQDRMKKSGAAWDMQNADAMISLRVLRANQQWNQFWKN